MVLRKEYFLHFFSYSLVIIFIALLEYFSSLFAPQWTDEFITRIKYYAIINPNY